jgi:ATP-binding cassette subfamily B protein
MPSRWTMPDRPRSRNYAYLLRTWDFMRPYKGRIVIAAIALVVTSAAMLSLGVGFRYVIDHAHSTAGLNKGLGLLMGITAVMAVGSYFRFYNVSWIGERVVADLRAAVYSRLLSLSPGYFETAKTGEILSRLTTDTSVLQTVIGSSLSLAVRNSLSVIGGVMMLIITAPTLAGLIMLLIPAVVVPILWFGRIVRNLSRQSQDRVADVSSYAEETLSAIRTVQAFVHEDRDRKLFAGEVERAFGTAMRRIFARGILGSLVILLAFGAIAVVLWAGGHEVDAGKMTWGDLTAFAIYAIMIAAAVGAVSEVIGDLQRAAGATERLVELLETEPAIKPPADPVPMPIPARGEVRFEDVTFHYPSRPDTAALHGLSLHVATGEHLALVGPSGAGKTTVFQLLLRFYDPQAGVVKIDGVDLREADPRDARARIGLVSQDPVIFATNAMENIRYGRPDASDAEVIAAAEAAAAMEFISKLPDGFGTFLGERGIRLSGGQKQRVAIARAILRDPALLLLDEATSALDAENERLVQKALERLMVGRTTMVIAHRLATVINADRIAVMDEGRLIATGRHHELLSSNPLYARLAALQFSTDALRDPAGIAAQ